MPTKALEKAVQAVLDAYYNGRWREVEPPLDNAMKSLHNIKKRIDRDNARKEATRV